MFPSHDQEGDISYGKKTAIQKYTRNIYVGEQVIFCSSSQAGSEDFEVLVPFKDFAYAVAGKYLTINENDDVEEVLYNTDVKTGYYRTFTEDFQVGTTCKVLLLDPNIENFLEDQYDVYFNDGQLRKHLHLSSTNTSVQIAGSDKFRYIDTSGGANDTLSNSTATLFQGRGYEEYSSLDEITTYGQLESYFSDLDSYSSEDIGNRFFVTFTTGSDGLTFYNTDPSNKNRRGIKTYEIQNETSLDRVLALSTKFGSYVS